MRARASVCQVLIKHLIQAKGYARGDILPWSMMQKEVLEMQEFRKAYWQTKQDRAPPPAPPMRRRAPGLREPWRERLGAEGWEPTPTHKKLLFVSRTLYNYTTYKCVLGAA